MSSTYSESFTSPFPICIPFISFSCLIVLARTFSTMLNNNNVSGYPYLFPDLRGKNFRCSPLSMMLTVDSMYLDSL